MMMMRSLRVFVCVCLCIGLLVGGWGLPSVVAKSTPSPPSAIEKFLMEGKLAEGETAMLALLQKNPKDDQARFSLAVTQLAMGVERVMQSLYRYGVRSNALTGIIPILRLPTPANPKPETIKYEDTRRVLQTFIDDLGKVEATLAPMQDNNVKLPLRFGLIRLDINGDRKVDGNESLWKIFATLNGINITTEQASKFAIAFDAGDAVWLRGYCNLLSAIGEFGLAHDGRDFFNSLAHILFTKPDTPYKFLVNAQVNPNASFGGIEFTDIIAFFHLLRFPIQEPARMTKALQHLQTTTKLSRQSWQLIMAETDNDREWLPNPKQKAVIPNARVTPEMVKNWLAFLDESDRIFTGQLLIPFWRIREVRGVNINKAFTQPQTIDVISWLQGPGAAPYLELGKTTQGRFWQQLLDTFGGQFFGFAIWFN